VAADLAATKPATDYDVMVFADFDLDKIRNARQLVHLYERRKGAEESLNVMTLLQPSIFAWQVMFVPLSPTER
jgi:hypothetical protein